MLRFSIHKQNTLFIIIYYSGKILNLLLFTILAKYAISNENIIIDLTVVTISCNHNHF